MTALARLALLCLRHARQPEELVKRWAGWADLVREVRRAPNGPAALILVLRYIFAIYQPNKPKDLVDRLVSAVSEAEEEVVTAAQQLIDEGIERGIEQANRKTLLMQLTNRFGPLPDDAVSRIHAAPVAQLETWLRQILRAQSLEDALTER